MPLTKIKSLGITDGTILGDDINSTFNLTGKTVTLPAGTGGKVLQVVQVVKSDVSSISSNSPTFVDISGLSATITPASTSNKVLIIVHINASSTSGYRTHFRLEKNGSAIAVGDTAGSRLRTTMVTEGSGNQGEMASMMFLDSPATTSSTTYNVAVCTEATGGNVKIGSQLTDNDDNSHSRNISTITLMEIAA